MISFMTDGGKRVLRTTNRYWFDYIKIDEFKLFFVRPTMVQQITQHFLRLYGNKPIGLSFEKIVPSGRTEDYPVHHLAQLTNLTSLRFDFYSTFWDVKEKTALTSLTNLLYLSEMQPTSHLTNLTTLTMDESFATLPLYNNLQSLRIGIEDQTTNPFALIGTPSKLTKLHVNSGSLAWPEISDNIMSQFGNLKFLWIHDEVGAHGLLPRGCLENLTGLETLDLDDNQPQDDIFKLTQLTELGLRGPGNNFNYHRLSVLTNIKSLKVDPPRDEDYSFLKSMTALESFKMYCRNHVVDALQHLNSQHLTHLSINDMPQSFNLDHLSNLTTLLELLVYEHEVEGTQNFVAISSLMNLTNLCILTKNISLINQKTLSNMTTLKKLALQSISDHNAICDLTLKTLTNLEGLNLSLLPGQTMFNDLGYLTRLTSLEVHAPDNISANNSSALDSLTSLKVLILFAQSPTPYLWHWFIRLADLEYLVFSHVDSEEVIESLSVLTNLTELRIVDAHSVKAIHLTKLTSLQILYLDSPQAKEHYKVHSGSLNEKLTRLANAACN